MERFLDYPVVPLTEEQKELLRNGSGLHLCLDGCRWVWTDCGGTNFAPFINNIQDTASIDLTVNLGGILTSDVKISSYANNALTQNTDGLFVPSLTASNGVKIVSEDIQADIEGLAQENIDHNTEIMIKNNTSLVNSKSTIGDIFANVFMRNQGTVEADLVTMYLSHIAISPDNFFILYINSQPATYGTDYLVVGNVITRQPSASYTLQNTDTFEAQYIKGDLV